VLGGNFQLNQELVAKLDGVIHVVTPFTISARAVRRLRAVAASWTGVLLWV
jgi:hypothetical protein